MAYKNNNTLSPKLSIKSQTIGIMVTGVTIMVILISLITSYVVNQQSRALMLNNAFQITEGLAQQSIYPILSGSKENAQTIMQQVLGFQSVITARLTLDSHDTFIELSKMEITTHTEHTQPNYTAIADENEQYWLVTSPVKIIQENNEYSDENEFELDLTENKQSEQIIGYAEVLYSKANLIEAQHRITLIIFLVGLSSVTILSFALYISLVKLFKPLNELESTMQQAKDSGDHIFAKIEGAKEIQNMANSYNSMMTVLEKHEDSITQHRDELEKEVQIRTKELVQARDSALTASRHKSEFMANMSHELRTPIQSIIGYSELINEELELEGHFELIDDIDKVTNNAQRLLAMINTLLDLAKIEAGKLDLHNTNFSVAKLEKDINGIIPPLALKNNNNFTINNQTKVNDFIVDKDKLEQILLNLLSNACKFTSNGDICLTIRSKEPYLCFDISDTGIGLTPQQQAYIFDEFRQVDSSDSRQFGGTGLGLAISKRFVELMNGRITVQSDLNKGATFTIEVPLIQN